MAYTNAADDPRARTSATPRTSTACSPASTPSSGPTTTRAGSTRAPRCRPLGERDSGTRTGPARSRADRRAARRTAQAARTSASRRTDPTLQHPRCVFQILKRHFARYTPEMVERGLRRARGRSSCGSAEADHARTRAGSAPPRSSTRSAGRSTPSACSTSAPRVDPAAAARQHRPARRRHPGAARARVASRARPTSRRCSTCCPGYIPMPHAHTARGPRRVHRGRGADEGLLGATCAPTSSACSRRGGATPPPPSNDFCFDYLPRLTGDHCTYDDRAGRRSTGTCKGYFLMGENPAVGSANGKHAAARHGQARLAGRPRLLADRERDVVEGRAGDRDRRAAHRGHRHRGVLPAGRRAHREGRHASPTPSGCCSGTTRPSSRRATRAATCGSSTTSAGGSARSWPARPTRWTGPVLDLTWDYPTEGTAAPSPTPRRCSREINGWDADGKPLSAYTELKDDGSTACGCWIYCGRLRRRRQPGRAPQARRRAELGRARVGLGVAGEPAHPLQPGLGRPRRQAVERAQGLRLVGRATRASGPGHDVPDFDARQARPTTSRPTDATGPDALGGHATRSSCRPTARRGSSRRPGWPTGRCRRTTSRRSRRSPTRCTASSATRRGSSPTPATDNLYQPSGGDAGDDVFPYVATTYRLTEHHTAGGMSGGCRTSSELQPEMFCEVSPELAAERGLEHGGWATIVTARSAIEARVLVTERIAPLTRRRAGRSTRSGCRTTGGRTALRPATRPTTCSQLALDPNVHIQEVKAFDLRHPARPPAARAGAARARRRVPAAGRDHRADRDGAMTVIRRAIPRDATDGRDRSAADRLLHRHHASASAARPARSRARSGTACPTTGCSSPACRTTTPAASARTPGGTSRSSSSSEPEITHGHGGDAERGLRWLMASRRLQALHARRLPRRLPDRRAVPHRVRHRRRAGGHLQRLRLLRPGLPVRRHRPAQGRRPRVEVHAVLRPAAARAWSRRARRRARPTRSSSGRSTSCASGPTRGSTQLHEAGVAERAALRRRPRRRRRRRRRVLPAARRARGLRAAARSGRDDA